MFGAAAKGIAIPVGFILGGLIGLFGAPAWEMAGLFVGFVGAVAGAGAAACMVTRRYQIVVATIVTVACTGGIALLSSSNPAWVTLQSTGAVAAAAVASGLVGWLLGALSRKP